MSKNHLVLLFLIVLLGAFLRLWQFGQIPQGFQVDEAAFGYNTYSLLKTGKDEYGIPHPLTLRSYNDYKAAFYSYVDIPFVAVMGLSEVAVRLPSALLGIIFIVLAYIFTFQITKDRKMSLIVSLLCAISPTFIFQNRIQSDPVLGNFLILLGLIFFVRWTKNKNIFILLGSFIFWGLSLISYQFPRIFLIMFLPLLFWHYRKHLSKKYLKITAILFAFLILSVVYLMGNAGRYTQTSAFTTPDVSLVLNQAIMENGVVHEPLIITRIFDNKPFYYGRALIDNYFSYLSFDFLFFQTTSPVREVVENTGFLYLIELPFLLIGIYEIIRKKLKWGYLLIGWVLIVPLGLSPFVSESPNIHRAIEMILPLEIIISLGILNFFELIKKRRIIYYLSIFILVCIFTYSLGDFLHELFIHQPLHEPWTRNYPYKQLIFDLDKYEPQYKKIVVTTYSSNTYIYYLFFNKYDPKKYQESGSHGNENYNTLGKYVFDHIPCPIGASGNGTGGIKGMANILYVDDGNCVTPSSGVKKVETIYWGDGSPAFKLFEYTH